jgi:hypothetical protein
MLILQLRMVYSRLFVSHLFCVVLPKPYRGINYDNHVTIPSLKYKNRNITNSRQEAIGYIMYTIYLMITQICYI